MASSSPSVEPGALRFAGTGVPPVMGTRKNSCNVGLSKFARNATVDEFGAIENPVADIRGGDPTASWRRVFSRPAQRHELLAMKRLKWRMNFVQRNVCRMVVVVASLRSYTEYFHALQTFFRMGVARHILSARIDASGQKIIPAMCGDYSTQKV